LVAAKKWLRTSQKSISPSAGYGKSVKHLEPIQNRKIWKGVFKTILVHWVNWQGCRPFCCFLPAILKDLAHLQIEVKPEVFFPMFVIETLL
jgi:hypothetical protein